MSNRRNLNGYISTNSGGNAMNIENYLTIVALEDGLTAQLSLNACEYCVDGDGNWKTLSAATNTEAINTGQTLSFRGNLTPASSKGIGTFTISKNCNLEGNCMSMLFGDEASNNVSLSGKNYAFYSLFQNCTTIKSVSSGFLPATTLVSSCYYRMFYGCTSLTTAPELPATTLKDYCYRTMFGDCTSLTTSPKLPAMILARECYSHMFYCCTSLTQAPSLPVTTLAKSCYDSMFQGCTSLTTAPELPATTLSDTCYYYMFYGCTSLTKAPSILPSTSLGSYCYGWMFQGCTSLTTAPELPATALINRAYYQMFQGCTKLNYIKAMFTTEPSGYQMSNWVEGVSSTGTFVKNKNATWNVTATSSNSYIGIPSGWTITTA